MEVEVSKKLRQKVHPHNSQRSNPTSLSAEGNLGDRVGTLQWHFFNSIHRETYQTLKTSPEGERLWRE